MPGSGPPDPEVLANAIKTEGAQWSSNHFTVPEGDPPSDVGKWPRMNESTNAWEVSTSPSALIDQDAFGKIRGGTLQNKHVLYGGKRYTVDPVIIGGSTWAVLTEVGS